MAVVIDLCAAALGIFAFMYGRRRGLISMVWGAAAWIITALLAAALVTPFSMAISNSQPVLEFKESIAGNIKKNVYDRSTGVMDTADFLSDKEAVAHYTGIPEILIPDMDLSGSIESAVSSAADSIVESVGNSVIRAASGVILFVGLRILMGALYRVLKAMSKLPVINGANRLTGGLLGLINYMFVMYAALALLSLFAVKSGGWQSVIEQTYLVKYFYNNNILLHLINL